MDKHIRCRKLMAIGLASEKTTQSAALLVVAMWPFGRSDGQTSHDRSLSGAHPRPHGTIHLNPIDI